MGLGTDNLRRRTISRKACNHHRGEWCPLLGLKRLLFVGTKYFVRSTADGVGNRGLFLGPDQVHCFYDLSGLRLGIDGVALAGPLSRFAGFSFSFFFRRSKTSPTAFSPKIDL